ncbi:unnamed protein product [Amoebophrya sp. A25]|nr:unnamed protein product [Amoebophrya sp. A25]|eukprot:GSA25T00015899001.1
MTAPDLRSAFAQARDRWQIDSQTLKGFYLHTGTNKLYVWEQAQGVLFEFVGDNCLPIWTSADPGNNAEIWTVLPLPPTDAAAQMQNKQEDVLSMVVEVPQNSFPGQQMTVLSPDGQEVLFVVPEGSVPGQCVTISYTRARDFLYLRMLHEEDKHSDVEAVNTKVKDFARRWGLDEAECKPLLDRVRRNLSLEGQEYLTSTFTPLAGTKPGKAAEEAVLRYVQHLERAKSWETVSKIKNREVVELKIDPVGAVLGTVLEQLAGKPGVAHAHCQISAEKAQTAENGGAASKQGAAGDEDEVRYYVRDLETTTGTFLDGERVPAAEPGCRLYDGQVLRIGDCCFRVDVHYVCQPGNEERRDARMERQKHEYRKIALFRRRQAELKNADADTVGRSMNGVEDAGLDQSSSASFKRRSLGIGGSFVDGGSSSSTGPRLSSSTANDLDLEGGGRTKRSESALSLDRAAKRRKQQAKTADTLEDVQRKKLLANLQTQDRIATEKENATEFLTADAQKEAGIGQDGQFFGFRSDTGRSGIGFGSGDLLPGPVTGDHSAKDMRKFKDEQRMKQLIAADKSTTKERGKGTAEGKNGRRNEEADGSSSFADAPETLEGRNEGLGLGASSSGLGLGTPSNSSLGAPSGLASMFKKASFAKPASGSPSASSEVGQAEHIKMSNRSNEQRKNPTSSSSALYFVKEDHEKGEAEEDNQDDDGFAYAGLLGSTGGLGFGGAGLGA